MNRILQCRKVLILAPRRGARGANPKRVGKIDDDTGYKSVPAEFSYHPQYISKKEILVKTHSLKEAGKNLILNLAFAFIVGNITYISAVIFFPEREALGIAITAVTVIVWKTLFQPLAEWAGPFEKRNNVLRFQFVGLCVFAYLSAIISVVQYSEQSSENSRMRKFYNSVKRMRDRKVAYEIALAGTIEAKNYKDDFDQIWNLDDEIFNQIDVKSTEDIKTQIHKLQNTVTETAQDE